jgi:radical SAM superfamily enzyme YgiQ (UPF0313 family)
VRPRGDGTLKKSPAQALSLAAAAAPDYGDYQLDSYFAPGPILPVLASRSCPWQCAFRSIPFASNKGRCQSVAA